MTSLVVPSRGSTPWQVYDDLQLHLPSVQDPNAVCGTAEIDRQNLAAQMRAILAEPSPLPEGAERALDYFQRYIKPACELIASHVLAGQVLDLK